MEPDFTERSRYLAAVINEYTLFSQKIGGAWAHLFILGGLSFDNARKLLPHNPRTIASVASLLTGSEWCGEWFMPQDAQLLSEEQ
jgi:hypothetical protein